MAFSLILHTSLLQHESPVSCDCHLEKGTGMNTFPLSIWDLQNTANKPLATNKKPLITKFRQSLLPFCNTAKPSIKHGVLNMKYLRNKTQVIYKHSFSDLQTATWRRKQTMLCQFLRIPHQADAQTPGRESLFSPPSSPSIAQLRYSGEAPALGYCTATGRKKIGKKRTSQRAQNLSGTLQLRSWKAQLSAVKQILSPSYGVLSGFKS